MNPDESGEWEVGRNKSTATTKPARGQSLLWILVFCSPNQTSLIRRHLNWFNRGAHMLGLRLVRAVLTSYAYIKAYDASEQRMGTILHLLTRFLEVPVILSLRIGTHLMHFFCLDVGVTFFSFFVLGMKFPVGWD